MAIATGATLDLGLSHVVGLYCQNVFMAFTERYRTCATPCGEDAKYAADDAPEWKRTFSRVVFLETLYNPVASRVNNSDTSPSDALVSEPSAAPSSSPGAVARVSLTDCITAGTSAEKKGPSEAAQHVAQMLTV